MSSRPRGGISTFPARKRRGSGPRRPEYPTQRGIRWGIPVATPVGVGQGRFSWQIVTTAAASDEVRCIFVLLPRLSFPHQPPGFHSKMGTWWEIPGRRVSGEKKGLLAGAFIAAGSCGSVRSVKPPRLAIQIRRGYARPNPAVVLALHVLARIMFLPRSFFMFSKLPLKFGQARGAA